MMLWDVVKFLAPVDPFQIFFLLVLMVVAGYNIWNVRRYAKESYWEAAWGSHTPHIDDDDLDAEHGSITDLSQAVAHKSERTAELMPGILLVIGLLGTFIGIGLALNKAANILSIAQGDDAARAVKEMLPMLNGLGTKFKTSTWGILGFLMFKTWHSGFGNEEKRLKWCIKKSRLQMNQRREEARLKEEENHSTMRAIVKGVGEEMCQAIRSEVSLNREVLTEKLVESRNNTKVQGLLLAEIHRHGELHHSIKENSILALKCTQEMSAAVLDSIEKNAASSAKMSGAGDKMATSAKALDQAIATLREEITVTLNAITKTLDTTLSNMSSGFIDTMKSATDNLNETIERSSQQLDQATNGIHTAVSAMSEKMGAVLTEMNDGFVSSMVKGSEELRMAMEESSGKLGEATGGIREAVVTMSGDVKQTQRQLQVTMATIGTNMEQMDLRQAKILASIQQSTQKLDEASNVSQAKIQDVVSQLSERMQTISRTNLEMITVVKRVDAALTEFNQMLSKFLSGRAVVLDDQGHDDSQGMGARA